jgi:putative oxidoreductase
MKVVVRMNKWANARTNIVLDAFRVGLGVFLFWKGLRFSGQTDMLVDLMQPNDPVPATIFLAHYIAMAHIAGGILVAFGLLTRLSILAQLPILIGAVAINFTGTPDWWNLAQASVGLAASLFFFIIGSGKHSVDYNLRMNM